MSRFLNTATKVTFSVDDSKDDRYSGDGFEIVAEDGTPSPVKRVAARKPAAKKAAAKKTAATPEVEPGTGTPPEPDPAENS